jgi:hypothetical protein
MTLMMTTLTWRDRTFAYAARVLQLKTSRTTPRSAALCHLASVPILKEIIGFFMVFFNISYGIFLVFHLLAMMYDKKIQQDPDPDP